MPVGRTNWRTFMAALGGALLLVLALPAKAERAMSCPDFRLALWRAIDDDGNKVARPQFDKAAGGFGPVTSYEMTE